MSERTEQSARGWKMVWATMVVAAALGLQAVAVQAAGGFSINPFTPSDGMVLNGNAALTDGALRITPAVGWQVGSAFYPYLVNVSAGFSTTFTFQITENGGDLGGGDGFAFLIQNDPSGVRALGEGGGGLGYSSLYDALAVEFDTYNNTDWDPNANHVGLLASRTYLNSYHSNDGLALNDLSGLSITLMDHAVHTVTITYTPPPVLTVAVQSPESVSPPTGSLSVTLDGNLLFSKSIDLTVALALNQGSAYLGFSAGSGYAFENNDILSWSLDGQVSSQSLYDDYCRSTLTVDPISGYWSWAVLKGNGAGNTYTGMGKVVNGSGYIRITALPGQGMAMNLIDYTNAHRATATLTYRADAVSSALYDSNTNLLPPCAEEGNGY